MSSLFYLDDFRDGGKWLYSCLMEDCFQDMINITCSILLPFPSSFFSISFVCLHGLYPYCSLGTTTDWKIYCFILSDRSDFHMINNLSIAIHDFARWISTSLSGDEMLLPRFVNLSKNFEEPTFRVQMSLEHMYSLFVSFTGMPMPLADSSRLW